LDTASRRLKDIPTNLLMGLLSKAIPEINSKQGSTGTMTRHTIERAFDELRTRGDVPLDDIAQLEFAYLPVFRMRKKPLVLHRMMVEKASFFVEVVSVVFKPEHGEARPPEDGAKRQAGAAYELLEGLRTLPGQTANEIDETKLLDWCFEVRDLAKDADRLTMAEQRIGHMFARAPASTADGAWPHEAVRRAIEKLASDALERGVAVARVNMRGVYSKSIGEGGAQERELAAESLRWAEAMPTTPRTAAMLRRISENWMRYAERADVEANEDALRW
jgi:hypothetical protein